MEGTGEREKTLLDRVLENSIFVDFAEEPIFGIDSVLICKKNHRFGTVTVKLMNTDMMVCIFDILRRWKSLNHARFAGIKSRLCHGT